MLNAADPLPERAEAARDLRAMLDKVGRDLAMLPAAVGKVRATMPPPQDPVSLDRLLESCTRALHHRRRAFAELGPGDGAASPTALADIHELVEEIRAGLSSPRILDDIGEMEAELSADAGRRALRSLDTRVRRIGAQADSLFSSAITVQQDTAPGVTQMASSSPGTDRIDPTAEAVRDLSEMLATTLAGSAATAATSRATGRRYPAVADQIAASLDAFGLPHDGVQLPPTDEQEQLRAQLIDGLKRNFAWREQDGTRVYYRAAPQPTVREPDVDPRLLRGSALVNAKLLRAEADGVLAIMDRLPDMLRFAPSQPLRSGEDRARLRTMLDQLVATAADPLGLNAQRGRYQFERLNAALIDILVRGEVIGRDTGDQALELARDNDPGSLWSASPERTGIIFDNLRVKTSAVREEEVKTEIAALGQLMDSILTRVSVPIGGMGRGVAASRLEELLTAADSAAEALENDLVRFGTTPAEQEVQFLGADGPRDISLAQFIGWVRALCAPFVGIENAAAALTQDELKILGDELADVAGYAGSFGSAITLPTSFGGVRRQFAELKRFLDEARTQAVQLAGEPPVDGGYTSARTSRPFKE